MSGMFDKKTDKAKRKLELTQKEQKARRKRTIITVTVTVVFLIIVVAAVLLNSNFIRRSVAVVTIDGIAFTTAEFEYFYNNEYMQISNELQSQGMEYLLPDPNRSLTNQIDPITGQSWADLITDNTLLRLQNTVAVYKEAQAAGFVLSSERLAEIDEAMMMQELQSTMYQFPSVDSYLQYLYGVGINADIYLEMLKFTYLAEDYVTFLRDSFEYSDEQLDEYYSDNADILDIFRFRFFLVEAEEPEEIQDDPETALEVSMNAAKEMAETYASGIITEDDFIAAAFEYNAVYYAEPDYTLAEVQGINTNNMDSLDFYFSSWLSDNSRKAGDVTVIDTHIGAAVLMYLSRDNNDYRTVGMRQILISRENVNADDYPEGEYDPDYIAALDAAAEDATKRAELAYSLFVDGGATEDTLIALIDEHSDDTTEGGYYDNIAMLSYQGDGFSVMRVVPELEDWLFTDGRAVGDAELIETAAYGYHLIYFTGYGDVLAKMMAEDALRTGSIIDWQNNLIKGDPVKSSAFILVAT